MMNNEDKMKLIGKTSNVVCQLNDLIHHISFGGSDDLIETAKQNVADYYAIYNHYVNPPVESVVEEKELPKNPKHLQDCIMYLLTFFTPETITQIRDMKERDFLVDAHHGIGRSIRNEWELWVDTSPMYKFFEQLGIKHADDMSSIILTSLHRELNEKDVDLDGQVQYYLDYWAKSDEERYKLS